MLLSACAAPAAPLDDGAQRAAATAVTADGAGGLPELIEAAQAEGELNVVALPPERVAYGAMISAFETKYRIRVNVAASDASDQEAIDIAERDSGSERAPDVFDLSQAVARANADEHFAEYRAETWAEVPTEAKHPNGRYVGGYTARVSVGVDTAAVPVPDTLDDLLDEDYHDAVVLDGDPRRDDAALAGVVLAAAANGGGAEDLAPGVEFFAELARAGTLRSTAPGPRRAPVVIDWDHANARRGAEGGRDDWRVVVFDEAAVEAPRYQAINADAPHPAAARLWQEFVLSDEGQRVYRDGFARPVRAEAMAAAGTLGAAPAAVPEPDGDPVVLTDAQAVRARGYLVDHWDPPEPE